MSATTCELSHLVAPAFMLRETAYSLALACDQHTLAAAVAKAALETYLRLRASASLARFAH